MQVRNFSDIPPQPIPEAPGAMIRWLWASSDGAPTFSLRLVEIPPGGTSPHHAHPYEHEAYILSGKALLRGAEQEHSMSPGDTALILPDEKHQFANLGNEPLRFLCIIPNPK